MGILRFAEAESRPESEKLNRAASAVDTSYFQFSYSFEISSTSAEYKTYLIVHFLRMLSCGIWYVPDHQTQIEGIVCQRCSSAYKCHVCPWECLNDKSTTGCNVSTYLGFVNAGMDEVHFDREVLPVPGGPTTRNVGLW